MKTRYCGQRLVFSDNGQKECSKGFFQAFSFDSKVYGSYLAFVETPAWRGFVELVNWSVPPLH